MTQRSEHVGAPSALHSLIEWRAVLEMATLPLAWPFLKSAPRGDGHPVLLLPGFMAEEGTLVALKMFLRGRGYNVQAWGMGRNVGFQRRHAEVLEKKIRYLHHQTGRRVSLVGSYNLDPRSERLNGETALVFENTELAARLAHLLLQRDLRYSRRISPDEAAKFASPEETITRFRKRIGHLFEAEM